MGTLARMGTNARQNVKNQVEIAVNEALQAPYPPMPAKPASNALLEHIVDIPLLDTLARINAQVSGLQKQLVKVEVQVATALDPPASDGDVHKEPSGVGTAVQDSPTAPEQANSTNTSTFLTGVDVGGSTQVSPAKSTHPRSASQLGMTKGGHGATKDAKSVEHLAMPFPFPGEEALELPGKVSANDLIKRVSDQWKFVPAKDHAVWSQCLASKEAQNLVKDLFWWFFCERFQAGVKAAEQEVMFKRMACNFVRLLTRVPQAYKDKFFDRFHIIMSNGVFAAYRVALPESEAKFDEGFRSELCRLAAYWTTGADIGPSSYVLPNGKVVKENTGNEHVEQVILELVREQAELEEMTDKRPKVRSNASVGASSVRRMPAATATLSDGGKTARSRGVSLLGSGGMTAGMQGQATMGKPSPHVRDTGKGAGFGGMPLPSASAKRPPPVPLLRLPVMKNVAQKSTSRAIWSERGSSQRISQLAEQLKELGSPTGKAATSRPAVHASDGMVDHGAGSTTQRGPATWRGTVTTPRTSAADCCWPPMPAHTARPTSSSSRSSRRRLVRRGADMMRPGGGRGGTERQDDKIHYFDLRNNSPFLRYYMQTQVTTTISARPQWKRMLADGVSKAWERPVPTSKPKSRKLKEGQGEDEDEQEEEQVEEQVAKTPREIAEAAVKMNARIVREYRKRATMRGNSVSTERQKMQDFYREQRKEMKQITGSQEMAHVFSNLLVSTGAGKNFEQAWKKLGKEAAKEAAKEHRKDHSSHGLDDHHHHHGGHAHH